MTIRLTLNTSQHSIGCSPVGSETIIAGAIEGSVLCELITFGGYSANINAIAVSVTCEKDRK